jgi:uroporphyrin-III C-methyltransferase/precorrin-2 dehydrogenase/sirohydrochlorin ferrochelatase
VAGTTGIAEFTLHSADPDDLTLRQVRWLGSADAVCHETGVPEAVLIRARADAVRHPLEPGQAVPALAGRVVVIRLG